MDDQQNTPLLLAVPCYILFAVLVSMLIASVIPVEATPVPDDGERMVQPAHPRVKFAEHGDRTT